MTGTAPSHYPRSGSHDGVTYADDRLADFLWYVPDVTIRRIDADLGFRFAVRRLDGVGPAGEPLNEATLEIVVGLDVPAEAAAAKAQNSFLRLQPVTERGSEVSLLLEVEGGGATASARRITGLVADDPDGRRRLRFPLTGPDVVIAYQNLVVFGGATLHLQITYLVNDGSDQAPHLVEIASTATRALGSTFAADPYRAAFTLTADGLTRAVVDVEDLVSFTPQRSEFRELTSLGDVQSRYPSLRRLYLGQVGGSVVAVPMTYGIVRGAQGCAARCTALIDTSPASQTGCRFTFTFTLAPAVDPVDLLQLAADLPGIPEAADRELRLALPAGLDPRFPARLSGARGATSSFSDGPRAQTVLVSVDVADTGELPAMSEANLFLAELTAGLTSPLFAEVALRLDDPHPGPVATVAVLDLHTTASSDDLVAISSGADPPTTTVTNRSPFTLALVRAGVLRDGAVSALDLGDHALASGETLVVGEAAGPPALTAPTAVVVQRRLALPAPFPRADVFRYVEVHSETVQQAQHPLTLNATAVDLAAHGVAKVVVAFALVDLPALPVPTIVLTPAHRIDFVHVSVPVTMVVTGLVAELAITLSTTAGERAVSLRHDFLDEPVLVLTTALLGL